MKRYIFLAIVSALFSDSAGAQKTLTVLHTSDTLSCVLPLNKNLADTMLADRGGFVRRIAMLKQERVQDPDLLLFDCGDFSQGSSYYTMFQGDVEVGLMNQMHYDAGT
ncbi:MAG: bifunctional metallophosphatase/5'-nucleotidase, partial [Prevotella sp.]|nr:bifunctional metallophosphatase/5'-nucleotidase [Prevotella sp.]